MYGTFAEIGAGQEVARYFFQVGAAAGTIAMVVFGEYLCSRKEMEDIPLLQL